MRPVAHYEVVGLDAGQSIADISKARSASETPSRPPKLTGPLNLTGAVSCSDSKG
ncbi:hypothetical protein [Vibrio cyclitrophicus]|uniref:hypothetical protein n=1 Tax=Vibrio cyclitrophicus TaxID=47951 RepID=UPI0002DD06EE|nr:hypothetical protein [Vibrio cyclitrophicus]